MDFALANNIFHTANISDNQSRSALIIVSFESPGVALSKDPIITVFYHYFVELWRFLANYLADPEQDPR